MYYEVPVTIFDEEFEPTEYRTLFVSGSYSEAATTVEEYLYKRYKDYDYELIETTEEEYKLANPEDRLDGSGADVEGQISVSLGASEAAPVRSIEDDMEDLQDRYYELSDKLNSIPMTKLAKNSDYKRLVDTASVELVHAKATFDQYDFYACKAALDSAETAIDNLMSALDSGISNAIAEESLKQNQFVAKKALEEISASPDETQRYSVLSDAIKAENDTVILYQNLAQQYPDWTTVLQDIIDEELKHVGQLEDLRNRISTNIGGKIAEGETEGQQQIAEDGYEDDLSADEGLVKDELESEDKQPKEAVACEGNEEGAGVPTIGGKSIDTLTALQQKKILEKMLKEEGFDVSKKVQISDSQKHMIDPYSETKLVAYAHHREPDVRAVLSMYDGTGVYFVKRLNDQDIVRTPDLLEDEEGSYYDGIATTDEQFAEGIRLIQGWLK